MGKDVGGGEGIRGDGVCGGSGEWEGGAEDEGEGIVEMK